MIKKGTHLAFKRQRGTVRERLLYRTLVRDNGCWEWQGAKNNMGYGEIGDGKKIRKAHRVAYEAFVGQIPDGAFVLHRCDNPLCVNPEHLWLGNNADNMRDMESKGRAKHPKGEYHGRAKLTEVQVREILRMAAEGVINKAVLARQCGVTETSISLIIKGKNWKHIQ